MTGLPEGWEATTVGTISAAIRYGYTASSATDPVGPRMLRITDIQDGSVDWPNVPYCEATSDDTEKFALVSGDLVFARTGGTVGKSFLIRNIPEPTVFASYLIKVSAAQGIAPTFLYWFFQSLSYWEQIGLKKGGLQGNVNATTLSTIELPIAPLPEQHRIVAKIEALFSELDAGTASLTRARAQLKTYRQALLKAAFEGKLTAPWRAANPDKLESPQTLLSRIRKERDTRHAAAQDNWQTALSKWRAGGEVGRKPGKPRRPDDAEPIGSDELANLPALSSGWKYCRFAEFVDHFTAGNSFACEEREPRHDEIGVAKVSAVSWGEYNEAESKTCKNPDREDPDLFIKEGDFLLSRANTIELVGACVIVRQVSKRVMLSDKTLRLSFGAGNSAYFLHYLRSLTGRAEIEKRSSGNQESMRNIGQERIRNIIVPICGNDEAAQVLEILDMQLSGVSQIDSEITTALARITALRQSILKKAFSGQLVPQDPADEPASALLARRAQTPAPKPRRKTKP